MLLVSHEPHVITTFCDRAVLLENGRVAIDGHPREVADRYVSMLTEAPDGAERRLS